MQARTTILHRWWTKVCIGWHLENIESLLGVMGVGVGVAVDVGVAVGVCVGVAGGAGVGVGTAMTDAYFL
jgi:hypothetical protein